MRNIALIMLLVLLGCNSRNKETLRKEPKAEQNSPALHFPNPGHDKNGSVIEGSIGIVGINDNFYKFNDTIRIFRKNKSDELIVITDEYEVVELRCVAFDKDNYTIELQPNELGFIPKSNKKILFKTWEQHILSTFSVSFDPENNPLYEKADIHSDKIMYLKDEMYHPDKIYGDWLRVKWGYDTYSYGWIRWKENDKLIIDYYFFA